MRRLLALTLLAAALALPAAELPPDADLLAAARVADQAYQLHLASLRDRLASTDPEVRISAVQRLGRLQDPQSIDAFLHLIESGSPSPAELSATATALGMSGQVAAAPALRKLTTYADADVRIAAYNALNRLEATTGGDHFQRAVDPDSQPHVAALTHLGTLKQADAAPLLVAGLARHPRSIVRRQCAIGLGRLGDPANGPALQAALSDSDPGVRRYAAEAIAKLDYRPAIPFLLMALEANLASDSIDRVVRLMTGQDFGFDPRSDSLKRRAAIERGFSWWTKNGAQEAGGG